MKTHSESILSSVIISWSTESSFRTKYEEQILLIRKKKQNKKKKMGALEVGIREPE